MSALLEVRGLKKTYDVRGFLRKVGEVEALRGVSFSLEAGETIAIVGESGCGKTTLAKCLMRIETPTSGEITFEGKRISEIPVEESRRDIQMIFQDPYGSLNPRKKAWQIISEPLAINTRLSRRERRERAQEKMEAVGLRPELAERYPHMFSGGQRQRLGIARALMLEPRILMCDEPVSALDVSIQAQILNLLMDLQQRLGLSYVFISHDLSVVRHIADQVLVIYKGEPVEQGARDLVFNNPLHAYTRRLLSSIPVLS